MMRSKKSASKLAVAVSQAKDQAGDLQDRIAPAVEDARQRITPMVADARERVTPVVAEAKERLTPVVDDARSRLADLAETVATKLDETLPDEATPAVVKEHSARRSGGRVKKLLVLLGLGAVVAVVAKRLRGGSEPQWQSTPPSRPVPAPRPAEQAAPVSGTTAAAAGGAAAAAAATVAEEQADDSAGGSPDEAVADAAEAPHQPTTPDAPAERIDLKE